MPFEPYLAPHAVTPPYANEAAHAAAWTLRHRLGAVTPRVAVILGSGLGELAHAVRHAVRIPYHDIPGLPTTHVEGHAGELVVGELDGIPTLLFAGRFHLYEGHSAQLVAFPVRIAHALGVRTLIVSSAMGAINRAFAPGDLMIMADHLNLMSTSPLVGPWYDGDVRFPDMSDPYDATLRVILRTVAAKLNIPVWEGVYAALLGPAYETPAEIRMLHALGADAVCMSTVPEVLMARALSMRVAGVSCITNMASGVSDQLLDHADVLRVTARISQTFQALIRAFIAVL